MFPLPQRGRFVDRSRNYVDKSVAFNKPTNDPQFASNYLNCRYAPFGRTGQRSAIPDGRGVNVVVRDYKTSYDIVTGSQGAEIRVSPIFPFPVRFAAGPEIGGGSVNGITLGSEYTAVPPPNSAKPYIGFVIPSAMSALLPTIPSGKPESTRIISARVVTVGYRLFYTGKAADATGLVLVDNLPFKYDSAALGGVLDGIQYGVGTPGTNGKNQAIIANTAPVAVVDFTPFGVAQTNAPPTQITLRPESGLEGVLKYQKNPDAHDYRPWFDQGAYVYISTDASDNSYVPIYGSTQATITPTQDRLFGAFCIDDALQEVNIRITGNVMSFRLEIIMCIEQEVALDSNILDMAKPSPMLDRALLDIDAKINAGTAPAAFAQSISTMMGAMSLAPKRRRRNRRRRQRQRNPPQQQQPKRKVKGNKAKCNS